MRGRHALVAIAALLAGAGASRGASAQTPADKLAAQKLLTQGNQAVGEGDYLTALDRFKKAYDRFPSPKVLVNIGSTQRLLGRYVDAAETYESFLSNPAADKARIPEVTRALREIDSLVARLKIVMDDAQASVRLDGKEIPHFASGVVLRVDAGEHTVVAVRDGFQPALRTLQMKRGDESTVTLTLKLPERVIVRTAGPQRVFGFVVAGVGAAGVIAGLAVGGVALSTKHSAESHCFAGGSQCDSDGVSLASRANTFGNVSTGVFFGSLAVVGAGVVLVLTAPTATTTTTRTNDAVALSFAAGADGSLLLRGAW